MERTWIAVFLLCTAAECGGSGKRVSSDSVRSGGVSAVDTGGTEAQHDVVAGAVDQSQAGTSGIELYPASMLARVVADLAHGNATGRTFGGHPSFHYVESRRASDGEPEVHDRWIDVTFVQAGRATLLTGGRVEGGRLEAGGEHRGGTIVGGVPHGIGAGDLVVIPAGVPHQFRVASPDTIVYLTIKVATAAAQRAH